MSISAPFPHAFVLSILFLRLATASLTSTGQTLLLDDIPYYVPAAPFTTVSSLASLKPLGSAGGLIPVTVLGVSATNPSLTTLAGIIDGFGSDDVWNGGFLEGKCTNVLFPRVVLLCTF